MYLYHYSTDRYLSLLTRELQGIVTAKERTDALKAAQFRGSPYTYNEHISFFLEPIPAELMGSLYPSDHSVWVTGKQLYEYRIKLSDIKLKYWELVEGKKETWFNENIPWFDNDFYKRMWFKVRKASVGDYGKTATGLKKAAQPYIGSLKSLFIAAAQHKDFKTFNKKYAANVIHAMVYTDKPIPIAKTQRITIGNKPATESYLNW